MITTKILPFTVEVICEPDNEYEYIRCESTIAGLFYLRCKNGYANIFIVGDGKGEWSEQKYDLSQMKNKESCTLIKITERTIDSLPTKKQYYANLNRDSN